MPRFPRLVRALVVLSLVCFGMPLRARAQEAPPPAYLAVVDGEVMLERGAESEPAVRDMPFVVGDRLRTGRGRVEIEFPDGTAIEVAENSIVECVSPTRVRLVAGTMDHLPLRTADPRSASVSNLPPDLQTYGGTFDRYGSWQNEPAYGSVWYPAVAADWRPYYYGAWSPVPSYGWTWIGADPWSYPTHHYGRWGYARRGWFWIPGRTWAPAWVSWGSAPDYVSWCPLGWDNRPVFALSIGHDRPWHGWTVMSRTHFGGRGYHVNRYAYDSRRFDRRTRFVQQSRAPVDLPHRRGRNEWSAAGRQSSDYGRRPSDDRQSSVGRRQSPVERRGTDDDNRPADRRLPAREFRRDNSDSRTPAGIAVPRRAYPIEAPRAADAPRPADTPRAAETPRAAAPGYAIPRDRRAPGTERPTNDARPTPDYRLRTNDRPTAEQPGRQAPRESAPPRQPAQRSERAASAPAERATPAERSAAAERAVPRGGAGREQQDGAAPPAGARRRR
jgi:hypothetical protein